MSYLNYLWVRLQELFLGLDSIVTLALDMYDGSTKFSLIAIPMFVLAGAIMSAAFFDLLPDDFTYHDLNTALSGNDDLCLERLCREYLPLSFSRRHGDPSRPWNRFAIKVKDEEGQKLLNYEGNWRDIFQNWEALGSSILRF